MGSTSHNSEALADVHYRERTFTSNLVPKNLSIQDLASSGFYHTRKNDDVKCFQCNLILNSNLFLDIQKVIECHFEMRPDCSFAQKIAKLGCAFKCPQNSSKCTSPNSSMTSKGNSSFQNKEEPQASTSSAEQKFTARPVECKGFHTFDSLRYERERLATFIDWPVSWLSPELLAEDGFYYLRDNDYVSCVFCRGVVGAWEPGDIPRHEHKRHFGTCPFVRHQPVGNVPITQGDLLAALPTDGPSEYSEYRLQCRKRNNCTSPSKSNVAMAVNNNSPATPSKNSSSNGNSDEKTGSLPWCNGMVSEGLSEYKGPKRKEFLTKESRFKSFKNWPRKVKQTPQELAEAGFFYCGLSDHVRCFHCGNGLRNWEADDNPWVEHARWYPQCNFVLLSQGMEFIDQVRRENPPYVRNFTASHVNDSSKWSGSAEASASSSNLPYVTHTYTSDVHPNFRVRITESQIDVLMELDIQKAVMDMGFPVSAVRKALREKVEETGVPFFSLESCIDKVLVCSEGSTAETEAERKQEAKMASYQREREERIRQSHEESLLRESSPLPDPDNPGEDVVNTQWISEPQNVSHLTNDTLHLPASRTPIITSPVMPPRRDHVNRNSAVAQQSTNEGTPDIVNDENVGSTALSRNINMQRQETYVPPRVGGGSAEESLLNNIRSVGSGSHDSVDIIEFPCRLGERLPPTSGSGFDRTSTPRTSPSYQSFASATIDTNSNTSMEISSSQASSGSSGNTSISGVSAPTSVTDPVSLEMIRQVDQVITLAEKERLRVCRTLSNGSTKSTGSCKGASSLCNGESSASSSDGEVNASMDEGPSVPNGEHDDKERLLRLSNEKVVKLEEQLERLRDSRLCKICMDAEMSVVFLPCTHMVACAACTLALHQCPICRTEIRHILQPNIVA